jgi:hypothetical protein
MTPAMSQLSNSDSNLVAQKMRTKRTQIDYHSPDGSLDLRRPRLAPARMGRVELADTAFRETTWPLAGVGWPVTEEARYPILISAGESRSLTLGYEKGAKNTIDWASATDVGRKSGPSCRDGNTSDRGGSNG